MLCCTNTYGIILYDHISYYIKLHYIILCYINESAGDPVEAALLGARPLVLEGAKGVPNNYHYYYYYYYNYYYYSSSSSYYYHYYYYHDDDDDYY